MLAAASIWLKSRMVAHNFSLMKHTAWQIFFTHARTLERYPLDRVDCTPISLRPNGCMPLSGTLS